MHWPQALLDAASDVGTSEQPQSSYALQLGEGEEQNEEGPAQNGQGDTALPYPTQTQSESGQEQEGQTVTQDDFQPMTDEEYWKAVEEQEEEREREQEEEEERLKEAQKELDPNFVTFIRWGRLPIHRQFSAFKSAKKNQDGPLLNPFFWHLHQPKLVPFEDESLPRHIRISPNGESGGITVDLDIFQMYAQSDLPGRRLTASRYITEAAMKLDEDDERQADEYFTLLEQLLGEAQCSGPSASLESYRWTPQQFVLDGSPKLFRYLRTRTSAQSPTHLTLFQQANLRLPIHFVRCMLEPPSHCEIACQQSAVQAIWSLLDEPDLLTQDVVQHLIVPAMFAFLQLSNEQFHQHMHAVPETEIMKTFQFQRWLRIRVDVLTMLTSLLCRSSTFHFSRNWLLRELIPRYMVFHIEPNQMILKKRELRELLPHSLAPMAQIAGSEFATSKLFPVFQQYMCDTPEVQNALLQHLADFCETLSVEFRECLVQALSHQITMDPGDSHTWRQRAQLANQLTKLIYLFPIAQINRHLSAFALAFSADRIADVRNSGVSMLATVLGAFIRQEWEEQCVDISIPGSSPPCSGLDSTLIGGSVSTDNTAAEETSNESNVESFHPPELPFTDSLLADIRSGFWRTRNWRRRQSFGNLLYLLVVNRLISDVQFYYLFFHDLMNVSDDDVANVRQYFCLLTQINLFDRFGQSVRKRLGQMAAEDRDLENRNLAMISLGKLDPEKECIDLNGRAIRLD